MKLSTKSNKKHMRNLIVEKTKRFLLTFVRSHKKKHRLHNATPFSIHTPDGVSSSSSDVDHPLHVGVFIEKSATRKSVRLARPILGFFEFFSR